MKKLKITSLILAVIMVASMLPLGMVSAFAAGEQGNPDDRTNATIATAADFVAFMENWMSDSTYYADGTVTLTADIDLSGVNLPKLYKDVEEPRTEGDYSDIKVEKIQNTFRGTFDGDGHTISGYAIVDSRADGYKCKDKDSKSVAYNVNDVYGLFGRQLSGEATIKNLTLNGVLGKDYPTEPGGSDKVTVNAADVGALYGYVVSGGILTVENVTVNGITSGSRSAGFVYRVNARGTATFTNCEMGGSVLNTWTQGVTDGVGGFVASNLGTVTITNCLMSGYVAEMRTNPTGGNGMIHTGGFVGYNEGTLKVSGSIVSGRVISHSTSVKTPSANVGLGGFVGYSKGTCEISGSMIHQTAQIKSSEPKTVDGTSYEKSGYNVGGFVGRAESGPVLTVENCAMYGTVTSNKLCSGAFFGVVAGTKLTVVGCIMNGQSKSSSKTNQLAYGINFTTKDCKYNIQGNRQSSGQTCQLASDSKYGFIYKDVWQNLPYTVSAANLYTLEKLETTIAGLVTCEEGTEDAVAWDDEVKTAVAHYEANWTFSGSALPVPNGCVSTLKNLKTFGIYDANTLLDFAKQLNSGNTFAGMTVKMYADVTLNEGWDAFATTETTLTGDATTTEKALANVPSTTWSVTAGSKYFAGTFDGQGHTISGIYQAVVAQNVGIFGNVAEGKTATIKNLKIENSYVRGAQGTGGLFGIAMGTVNIDNVYANIHVDSGYVNKTLGTSNYENTNTTAEADASSNRSNGTGGLIGGCNSKKVSYTITNTVFEGDVYGGHLRGLSAFCGNATTNGTITIQNCYAKANLTSDAAKAPAGKQAGAGAFVGYVGNASAKIELTDVVADCKYTGTTTVVGCLAAGQHAAATYTFKNVTYVDHTDNASAVIGTSAVIKDKSGKVTSTLYINEETFAEETDFAKGTFKWADYGVKIVDSAAELPAVLYAYNVDETMSLTLTDDLAVNLFADFAIVNEARKDATVKKVGNEYKITYSGILPQQIGDNIDLDLGAGGTKTVNIKNYLVKLLENANSNKKTKDVVADLLRYGAAAQKVADPGIADSDLVTNGLPLDGLGSTFDVNDIEAADYVLSDGCTFVGVALRLESSLALVARDAAGKVTTKSLMATQMDDVLTVTDGTSSVDVSVAWYVAQAMNGAVSDSDELALIKAIYAYGLSAKAYKA